eukprot:TRINITY_DN7658_c0_g1_i1.p1 TRINITY_DN7658_c0_g1~~TRINITY_DN7658_c0_g1_i1.p1  ORF type:complete len:392 (+),score=54.97 TRINITY_DN7658_c0_g1_i1:45-1178(+)
MVALLADAASNRVAWTVKVPGFAGTTVRGLAMSPDGTLVLATSASGHVAVISSADGQVVAHGDAAHRPNNSVRACAWLTNELFVTGSHATPRIVIWNRLGKPLLMPADHTEEVHAIVQLPPSVAHFSGVVSHGSSAVMFASGSLDRTVKVWQVVPGTDLHANPTAEVVHSFPASGTTIALSAHPQLPRVAAGLLSGQVVVFDYQARTTLVSAKIHGDWVRTMAYSPSGELLLTGSSDQTAKVLQASTLAVVVDKQAQQAVYGAAWLSESTAWTAAGSEIEIWNSASGQRVTKYSGAVVVMQACNITVKPPWECIGPLRDLCVRQAASLGVDSKRWPEHLRDEVNQHRTAVQTQSDSQLPGPLAKLVRVFGGLFSKSE